MKNTIDKVAWTPIRDRKILFARSHGKTPFYTVGGKRNPGESDLQTLAREAKEETGVNLDQGTVRHIHTFLGPAHGKTGDTLVSIACYDANGDREPAPSSEIEELAWLTSADTNMTTEAGIIILNWFREQGLID